MLQYNESINEEKLRSFSENCQGIQITFLDAENGKLLLFSQKEDMEDSIKIYFERISSEQLPCAFFDKVSKTYDNFEVSSQVAQMTVCFMEDGKIDVEWQYEEDEMYSEQDSLSTVVSEARDAKNRIEEKLRSFIVERQKDCEERSKRIGKTSL